MEQTVLCRGAPSKVMGAVAGATDGDVLVTFHHDGVAVYGADTLVGAATRAPLAVPQSSAQMFLFALEVQHLVDVCFPCVGDQFCRRTTSIECGWIANSFGHDLKDFAFEFDSWH